MRPQFAYYLYKSFKKRLSSLEITTFLNKNNIFLDWYIKKISKLIEYLLNGIYIICFINFYQDIIQVENQKNVKLFCKNLADITLEACLYIEKAKQQYLILKNNCIWYKTLSSTLLFCKFTSDDKHRLDKIRKIA